MGPTEQFEAKLNAVFTSQERRSQRVVSLLEGGDVLVGLGLRGHLAMEELPFTACAAHCADPKQLERARLRFPQLVCLFRALEKIPSVPPEFWGALEDLNSLRNSLAHRLEHPNIEDRIRGFSKRVLMLS